MTCGHASCFVFYLCSIQDVRRRCRLFRGLRQIRKNSEKLEAFEKRKENPLTDLAVRYYLENKWRNRQCFNVALIKSNEYDKKFILLLIGSGAEPTHCTEHTTYMSPTTLNKQTARQLKAFGGNEFMDARHFYNFSQLNINFHIVPDASSFISICLWLIS